MYVIPISHSGKLNKLTEENLKAIIPANKVA